MPSIIFHSRYDRRIAHREQSAKHNKKLTNLSEEQERPLFQVLNTVRLCDIDLKPPKYVFDTLSLGPKHAVLDKIDSKDILAELDGLLHHCVRNNVSEEVITDINVKTLNYIKKCKKMKTSRNIVMTKKYLKENNLLAVPFDKGIGIALMGRDTYYNKMNKIINLPQFEKMEKNRKNGKHPVMKEEERVVTILKNLRNEGKINEEIYEEIRPKGSQPARLYGLAKVHKKDTPVRPVLSMPGSTYHKVALKVAEWLSKVPECNINTSTKEISKKIKTITVKSDEKIVSFDVSSLYTNVPVMEAIEVCTNLLFNSLNEKPPVDRETFKILTKIASCDVVMSTHDGYYKQVDGLAMGSPPAPLLANGWMSQFDKMIRGNAELFARYMDDIICNITQHNIEKKLIKINNIHPNLKFTIETEDNNSSIPFLDMKIKRHEDGKLSSTWYNKPTDTGLIMNYHALAPKRYKRSVVSGFVYRIFNACSSWSFFHSSLEKAKQILEKNQYSPNFYNPIIKETLENIITERNNKEKRNKQKKQTEKKYPLMIQYRGKCTEDYARALHKCNAPCTIIMTIRKLKTTMPSLKQPVENMLRSGVVYKITCSSCKACYVGQTSRHLQTRIREHSNTIGPVKKHLENCKQQLKKDDIEIIKSTSRGETLLLTLEALWIRELKPQINTKDEYRSRALTIKI